MSNKRLLLGKSSPALSLIHSLGAPFRKSQEAVERTGDDYKNGVSNAFQDLVGALHWVYLGVLGLVWDGMGWGGLAR